MVEMQYFHCSLDITRLEASLTSHGKSYIMQKDLIIESVITGPPCFVPCC